MNREELIAKYVPPVRLGPAGDTLICSRCDRTWLPGEDPGCDYCLKIWALIDGPKERKMNTPTEDRPLYCWERLKAEGKGAPMTACLSCSREAWKEEICPHTYSTKVGDPDNPPNMQQETATEPPAPIERCPRCLGHGQIMGDAGEPCLCPACMGDQVKYPRTDPDGEAFMQAVAMQRAINRNPEETGPIQFVVTTTRIAQIAITMWRLDEDTETPDTLPYPRTLEAYSALPPSERRRWNRRAETSIRAFLGQYPTG